MFAKPRTYNFKNAREVEKLVQIEHDPNIPDGGKYIEHADFHHLNPELTPAELQLRENYIDEEIPSHKVSTFINKIVKANCDKFLCEYCGKQFAQRYSGLTLHLSTHTGEKPCVCEFCGKRFSRNSLLKLHLRTHTGEKPYMCQICGSTFATRQNWERHFKNHSGEKSFQCNICGKSFSQKVTLQAHLTIHTGEQKFCCKICDFKCSLGKMLKEHILKTHRETEVNLFSKRKTFDCGACGKIFSTNKSLQIHLKTTGEKPYACKICGIKFLLKANFNRHMLIHDGAKPFLCEVCNKSFTQKGSLQLHMKIHTGEKNFACANCKYKCSSKGQLSKHMVVHLREKQFVCDICKKRFLRIIKLKKHLNTHNM